MMFKHSTGWDINARMLRLVTDHERTPISTPELREYFLRIVREEIAQDRDLVWC